MRSDDVQAQVQELAAELSSLRKKVSESKPKDFWDKAGVVATFLNSVVLATVGLVFTTCYNQRQGEATAAAERERTRVAETEAVAKFIDHLAGSDPRRKKMAFIAIKQLSNTTLAVELAAAAAHRRGGSSELPIGSESVATQGLPIG